MLRYANKMLWAISNSCFKHSCAWLLVTLHIAFLWGKYLGICWVICMCPAVIGWVSLLYPWAPHPWIHPTMDWKYWGGGSINLQKTKLEFSAFTKHYTESMQIGWYVGITSVASYHFTDHQSLSSTCLNIVHFISSHVVIDLWWLCVYCRDIFSHYSLNSTV